MRKSKLLPVIVALALVAGTALARPLFESLERRAFDDRLVLRPDGVWPTDLVLVRIPSGRLREELTALLRELHARGAKTIAIDVAMPDSLPADAALARELSRTVIPISWLPGWRVESDPAPLASVTLVAPGPRRSSKGFIPATLVLAGAAAGQGHSLAEPAQDGVIRTTRPFVPLDGGGSLPSAPLVALMLQREAPVSGAVFDGEHLRLPTGIRLASADGDVFLDLAPGAGPATCDGDVLLAGGMCPQLKGALAIVFVDAPQDDRLSTPFDRFAPGGLLFALAIRTLDSGRSPRPVGTFLILLIALPIAIVIARTQRISAGVLAGFGYAALCLAFVPLFDVFLPIAPLAPLLLSGVAGRLASPERLRS